MFNSIISVQRRSIIVLNRIISQRNLPLIFRFPVSRRINDGLRPDELFFVGLGVGRPIDRLGEVILGTRMNQRTRAKRSRMLNRSLEVGRIS